MQSLNLFVFLNITFFIHPTFPLWYQIAVPLSNPFVYAFGTVCFLCFPISHNRRTIYRSIRRSFQHLFESSAKWYTRTK